MSTANNPIWLLWFTSSGISFNISGTYARNYGRVEVTLDGNTGAICNTGWGDADARVLCKSLNYTDGSIFR